MDVASGGGAAFGGVLFPDDEAKSGRVASECPDVDHVGRGWGLSAHCVAGCDRGCGVLTELREAAANPALLSWANGRWQAANTGRVIERWAGICGTGTDFGAAIYANVLARWLLVRGGDAGTGLSFAGWLERF